MRDDVILRALKALAQDDREKEAGSEVEARLLRAFHARRARRRLRGMAVAAGVAAGIAIAAFLWTSRAPKAAVSAIALVPSATEVMRPEPAPIAATAAAHPRAVARKLARTRPPARHEVVTDFFPLMDPAPPFERGQMLRVQLPAAAMQAVGLPVREEHLSDLVQADVLVGEEGMPRAIRFVRFDVQ